MSHIVSIKTEIRDSVALRAACSRLRLSPPVYGPTKLFSDSVTGWSVRLPDWQFPVVCDTEQRQLHYDNFNGRWGDPAELDRLLQSYAIENSTRPQCPP